MYYNEGQGIRCATLHGVTVSPTDFLTDQQQCPCMCECICICIYMFIYLWLKPTPVFLPGEVHGQRTLAGYSP